MSTICDTFIPGVGARAVGLDDSMRLCNGDVSLDGALADLRTSIDNGENFTYPNVDLLIESVMNAEWDN